MNTASIIQSIISNERFQAVPSLSIKPGQVIAGKVEKLFPNHTALVQIGSVRIHAQIEASIEANGRYLFEAQPTQSSHVILKVIEQKQTGSLARKDTIGSLLSQFQLPDTRLNNQLLQFLLTANLPFTKDQLKEAALWIKDTNKASTGLVAIERMLKKELPFTTETYKSMLALQETSTFSKQLENIARLLESPKFSNAEAARELQKFVYSLMEGRSVLIGQKMVQAVVEQVISPKSPMETKQAAIKILQDLQVLPKTSSPEQVLIEIQKIANNQTVKLDAIQKEPSLSLSEWSKIPAKLSELVQTLSSDTPPEEANLLKTLTSQMQQFKQNSLEEGAEVKFQLKQMIQAIGLEHEKEIAAFIKNTAEAPEKLESLKSLLLQAMAELGPNAKELEPLLHRISGLQLLAQESNGPMQQLFMQLPILIGNKLTDVTLQWSGRKTKDGQIDPSFCRILFYLDLHNIHQTIVDMKVQNRVISISIINDTVGLEKSIQEGQIPLKEQLATLDYILSSIKVIDSAEKQIKSKQDALAFTYKQQDYQGVDLKV